MIIQILNFVIAFLLGLAVALQLLHGDIEQLRREYMVLFTRGVSITRKLGFSDVIMPGRTPQTSSPAQVRCHVGVQLNMFKEFRLRLVGL